MNHRFVSFFSSLLVIGLAASLFFVSGCGGGKDKGKSKTSQKSEQKNPIILPDEQGPFDDDRLTFSTPKNWERQARNSKFAAWFKAAKGTYPHLQITAEAAPDGVTELTKENAKEHVSVLRDGKTKFKSVKVGESDYACVSFERKARTVSQDFDTYSLATIQAGRLYVFEIRVLLDEMKPKTRDTLTAILASAKFYETGGAPSAQKSDDSDELDFSSLMGGAEGEKKEVAEPQP